MNSVPANGKGDFISMPDHIDWAFDKGGGDWCASWVREPDGTITHYESFEMSKSTWWRNVINRIKRKLGIGWTWVHVDRSQFLKEISKNDNGDE